MRIISGYLKGRKLLPPKGREIRPTADRAKETLFNIICSRYSLSGTKVLELFCGSGAFGFECISRGSDEVVFVDVDTELVKKNAAHLGLDHQCRFVRADSFKFLNALKDRFDFIFSDPPYDYDRYDQLAEKALARSDVFVLEHSANYVPADKLQKYLLLNRKSGKARFSIFENSN